MNPLYESKDVAPISRRRFLWRLVTHAGAALGLIAVSLLAGMLGYRLLVGMAWIDAFLNASMLLAGMGPVATDGLSDAGKLFAGLYALYSGLVLIAIIGIMLAPVVHRLLHRFHWETPDDTGSN